MDRAQSQSTPTTTHYLPNFATALLTLAASTLAFLLTAPAAHAVNVTLSSNLAGKTPEIVGYNSGHFMPGSNTADWWHFSNVNGARVWPTPTTVEASDDLAPFGDGVSSQATFEARRTALRTNPLSTSYINWPYFESRYQNNPTTGSNIINLKHAFGQLHDQHIDPVVEINYTNGSYAWDPAGTTAGWADRWEQWQHFYAQAFYLAKNFDVHRFQMYNEPNGDDIPAAEWLERLRFSSDAVQAAVADVNAIYGKSLDAQVQAPVTAGNPNTYYSAWGQPAMQLLHTPPLRHHARPQFQSLRYVCLPALRSHRRCFRHRPRQHQEHRERCRRRHSDAVCDHRVQRPHRERLRRHDRHARYAFAVLAFRFHPRSAR